MDFEIYYGVARDDAQVFNNQVGVIDLDRQWGRCVIATCGSEDDPEAVSMARRIKASLEVTEPLVIEEIEAQAAQHLNTSPMRLSIYRGDVRLGDGTQGVLRDRIGVIDKSRAFKSCIIAICGSYDDCEAFEMARRITAALMCYSSFTIEELEQRAEEVRALRTTEPRTTSGYMPV